MEYWRGRSGSGPLPLPLPKHASDRPWPCPSLASSDAGAAVNPFTRPLFFYWRSGWDQNRVSLSRQCRSRQSRFVLVHSIFTISSVVMAVLNTLPLLEPRVDLRDSQFVQNQEAWKPIIAAFEEASKAVTVEARRSSQLKHQARGQLLGEHAALTQRDPPYAGRLG